MEPPKRHYYTRFEAPTDLAIWKQAILDSREGTPILRKKVFEQVSLSWRDNIRRQSIWLNSKL